MFLKKAFEGFQIARLADGYSPATLKRYEGCIMLLAEFLNHPELEEITIKDLRGYMAWLRTDYKPKRFSGDTSPLSGASLDNAWKSIRSIFGWAANEFDIPRPDINLERPKYQSKPVQPYSRDEIARLLKFCNRAGGKHNYLRPTAKRDQAIIMVLLDTGMRRGELLRLRFSDVNTQEYQHFYSLQIRSYRSGRKSTARVVYLGRAATRYLWRYLATRENPPNSDPLFLTIHNRPLTASAVKNILIRIGARAGVSNVFPHRFRHTFAIEYLRNRGDIYTLQRLLGHSTLDMVRRYLALSETDDKEAHQRANPGDRWRL